MPAKGRRRLTPEQYRARLDAYCASHGVTPTETGMAPFPAGQRETEQHREWIALYKLHDRLRRRDRGQCERCSEPTSPGSIFCDTHRPAARPGLSVDERHELLAVQARRCPICAEPVDLWDHVDQVKLTHKARGIVHERCHQLATLAESLGPEAVSRLQVYLWSRTRRPLSRPDIP